MGTGAQNMAVVPLASLKFLFPETNAPAQGGDAPAHLLHTPLCAVSSLAVLWWVAEGVFGLSLPAEPHHHPVFPHTAALGLLRLPALPCLLLSILRVSLDKVMGWPPQSHRAATDGRNCSGRGTQPAWRQAMSSRPPQCSRAPWVHAQRSHLLPKVLNTFRLLTKSVGYKMDLKDARSL